MKKNFSEDPLAYSRQRALQYQLIDGTFELTFGGSFLLMAACFWGISQIAISNSFISGNLLPFAPLVVFVGGAYLMDSLAHRLRMRITYARSGFIVYQKARPLKWSVRWLIWIGIPLVTALLLAIIYLNRSLFHPAGQDLTSFLMPSFFGLLFSGLWIIVGWKTSIPRFYLIAAVSLLVSAGLFLNGLGDNLGMALLFGVMGAVLCASGGLTLLRYLRKNPSLQETIDEQ
jgi:hypothetical protein